MAYTYYIYYRIEPAQTDKAGRRIDRLLTAVKQATGIAGRLMKKRGEPNLWMEVYENVTDEAKFEWALAEAVSNLKATEFLQPGGGRQVECFESQ